MQKSLTLETLGDLDGGSAGLIINAALCEALADLDDRGSDKHPRVVAITLTLKQMDNGLVESHVEAHARVPKRRTASTIARLSRDAKQSKLLFQDSAPEDPSQRTLDEISPKSFKKREEE